MTESALEVGLSSAHDAETGPRNEERRTARQAWPPLPVWVGLMLGVLGIAGIWPTAVVLHAMWVMDPLKSIGMLVPVVSVALIFWRWREIGWRMEGSWWGLALLAATMLMVRFREHSVLVLVLSRNWSIFFPPHSLVVLLYLVGWVLLLGGTTLLRAALFPVLLIVLVNPVPHIFNVYVDLPLQRVSAHVARGFALLLHQKLTPDQMRLMFTPEFGMFIAPGCNGIRGAVTMGMIALVVGYVYRFRLRDHVLFVAAAVLLGYVFNFVRLCTLVVYYIVALKLPWLQDRAEMGDYVIGGGLFFLAVYLLFVVVRYAARPAGTVGGETRARPSREQARAWTRTAALGGLVLVALARLSFGRTAPAPAAATGAVHFPEHAGVYALSRQWTEQMASGPVLYQWADYAPVGAPPAAERSTALAPDPAVEARSLHVQLGLSPVLGAHDVSVCHAARGEDPVWRGELRVATKAGERTFGSAFFNDGATQYLEVTTLCQEDGCGEYTSGGDHVGLLYSRPAPISALGRDPGRPIPVIVRVETLDTAMPADMARAELTKTAETFLGSMNMEALANTFRGR